MIFDWQGKRFHLGPYVRVGDVTLIRLWRLDYLRIGPVWKIINHEEQT